MTTRRPPGGGAAFNPYDDPADESDEDRHKAATSSRRPSLVKLVQDVRGLESELIAGFGSRAAVLRWSQRLTVRTLGEVPTDWYEDLADHFQGSPSGADERVFLSALLDAMARTRPVADREAEELRRQLVAQTVRPAAHRAFRKLRKDAGEYVDSEKSATASGHDPERQRYIAMRPSLDDIEAYQQRSLNKLLEGFGDREEILAWGHDLELATHGEIESEFVTDCYTETRTRRVLIGESYADARARELFAATYLIPEFNAGVRDLAGRVKEIPDAESGDDNFPSA
jgi:hypothetical protein